MLILGAVGLQIRLSDCSTFNLPLDLRSLAKQECFFRKDTTNETLQSDFPFVSFFSFDSFFSPLIVPLARLDLQSDRNEYKHFKCVNMFCVS